MDRHVKWLRRRIVASVALQTAGTFAVVAVLAFALVYWRSDEGPITSLLAAVVIAQLVAVARVGHAMRNNPLNYVYMRNYVDRPFSYRVSRFNREDKSHPVAARLPGFTAVATVRDDAAEPSPCFDVYHDPSRLVAASVSRASGSITLISSLADGRIMVTDARAVPPHERLVMNLAPADSIESIIDAHRRALSARPDVVELASSAHQVVLDSLALEYDSYVTLGPALSPFLDLEPSGRWGLRLIARIDPAELAELPATIGRDAGLSPRVTDGRARPATTERGAVPKPPQSQAERGAQPTDAPVVDVPEVAAPHVDAPEVVSPQVEAPLVEAPHVAVADAVPALPTVAAPIVLAPDMSEPATPPAPAHEVEPIAAAVTGDDAGSVAPAPAVTAGTADRDHALVIEAFSSQPTDGRRPAWISAEATEPPGVSAPGDHATGGEAEVASPETRVQHELSPTPVAPWVRRSDHNGPVEQAPAPAAAAVHIEQSPAPAADQGDQVAPSPWVTRDGDDPDVERAGEPITADVPVVFAAASAAVASQPVQPVEAHVEVQPVPAPQPVQPVEAHVEVQPVPGPQPVQHADVQPVPAPQSVQPVEAHVEVQPVPGPQPVQHADVQPVPAPQSVQPVEAHVEVQPVPAPQPVQPVQHADVQPVPAPQPEPQAHVIAERPATLAEAIVAAPDSPAALHDTHVRYRESVPGQAAPTAEMMHSPQAATLGPDLSAALGYDDEPTAPKPRLSAVLRANSAASGQTGKRRRTR